MTYFSPDFIEFFKELAANNNKDWFDQNRKRYEKEVKNPFKKLVDDLILTFRKEFEPDLLMESKDAIFRINRDIRFSKDKMPYKTNVSALLSPKGRKNHAYASFYLELGPEKIGIYGGCYGPNTQELSLLRNHIACNYQEFLNLKNNKDFIKHYPQGVEGEAHKRAPKELKEFAEIEPLILNKQFYYVAHLDPQIIATEQLMPTLLEYYRASFNMMQFMRQPFNI